MDKSDLPPDYNSLYPIQPVVQDQSGLNYGGPPPYTPSQELVAPPVLPPSCPIAFGPKAATLTCPLCHAIVKTTTETQPTTKSHLAAFILFVIGCYFCFCLPYCMDCCQSTLHYCPNCKAYLGKYNR